MFFLDSVKLFEYFFSAVSVVSLNPCVRPSRRVEISFFLLSTCAEEVISTQKFITFSLNLLVGNEKVPFISNPIPYPEYLQLSKSPFLLKIFLPQDHYCLHSFTNSFQKQCLVFQWVNAILSRFKQLPSNVTLVLLPK